jgi:adenylate cyclase
VSLPPAFAALFAASLAAVGILAWAVAALRRRSAILDRRVEQSARELDRLQRSFARFAPAELVERIASEGMRAGGERREVTVLFADLRGFTQLSEPLDPAVVVQMLNGYFQAMSATVQSHHGHVTRIMGDGIMSVFGALERNPWHVQDAVEAALDMRRALAAYNRELAAQGLPALSLGIGIHCGVVVAGLVGSEELQEFTVIGDVVNVASRVEGLTRRLGSDILVTGEVHALLGDRFRMVEMPAVEIKGKSLPIVTWAVQSDAAEGSAASPGSTSFRAPRQA